jgi:uncharacterized membrane protein YoaK (UPF0700 family)
MSAIHNHALLKPERQSEAGHPANPPEIEEWLAVCLAMISGFIDAYGMITYHTYLSFMSGNTTQTGYEVGQGNFARAVYPALAIVFFGGGSFVGGLLGYSSVRGIQRLVFAVLATLLTLIVGFAQLGHLSDWVNIAMISFAMGAINTALSRVGTRSVSLTFVTGTLSTLGLHLALALKPASPPNRPNREEHARRALSLAAVWAGFLSGAFLSGVTTPRFGVWALLLPMLAVLVLAAFDRSLSMSDPRYAGSHFQ